MTSIDRYQFFFMSTLTAKVEIETNTSRLFMTDF